MIKNIFIEGMIPPITLAAGAILGLVTAAALLLMPITTSPLTSMYLDPIQKTATVDEIFSTSVMVESSLPVNAFTGKVNFNHAVVEIEKIDYNTSIADLWAEEPWYKAGAGTVSFTGGTTQSGGFTGSGSLLTIYFRAIAPGDAAITFSDVRILQHDGLGTEALLAEPIDTIFTVLTDTPEVTIVSQPARLDSSFTVLKSLPSTDLNNDGAVTISDISIFMLYMTRSDKRADFNGDGSINTADLSILLSKRKNNGG